MMMFLMDQLAMEAKVLSDQKGLFLPELERLALYRLELQEVSVAHFRHERVWGGGRGHPGVVGGTERRTRRRGRRSRSGSMRRYRRGRSTGSGRSWADVRMVTRSRGGRNDASARGERDRKERQKISHTRVDPRGDTSRPAVRALTRPKGRVTHGGEPRLACFEAGR